MGGWRTQSVILSCLVASYNIHADVWQHMLMTHHNNDRPITIQETQNVMNDWRISAHLFSEESDGKLLGWSGCSWSHDLTNPNIGLMSLRIATPSWGKGVAGTVVFRMHAEGSCQQPVFQINARYVCMIAQTV